MNASAATAGDTSITIRDMVPAFLSATDMQEYSASPSVGNVLVLPIKQTWRGAKEGAKAWVHDCKPARVTQATSLLLQHTSVTRDTPPRAPNVRAHPTSCST